MLSKTVGYIFSLDPKGGGLGSTVSFQMTIIRKVIKGLEIRMADILKNSH